MSSLVLVHGGDRDALDVARRMLEAAPHRGTNYQLVDTPAATIGITRISEADPTASLITDNGISVAFIGHLDNSSDLRAELGVKETRGEDPSFASLAASAFSRWGTNSFARLRGAFTLAIASSEWAVVARDHLGFKPLFYREKGGVSYWATEVKQVRASTSAATEPNIDFILSGFFGRRETTSETAIAGVNRFPRGTWVKLQGGSMGLHRYWDPARLFETRRIGVEDAAEELAGHFARSIGATVTGHDAVALSGGIDSPLIAAYAAGPHLETSGRPLLAVSAVYPDLPDVDESRYIKTVVEKFGLEWQTFHQTARPLDDIQTWVKRLDSPGTNLSMPEVFELYRLAASHGAKTVFTGELAEYIYAYHADLLAYLITTMKFPAAASHIGHRRRAGTPWAALVRELARSLAPSPLLYRWLQKRTRAAMPEWIDFDHLVGLERATDYPWARRRWKEAQLGHVQLDHAPAFEDVDIAASHAGVTVRMPIASVDIWEFMLSLPAEIKYPHPRRKTLVRQAIRGVVPDEIVNRQDKTFFDAHALASAEYDTYHRWTIGTSTRLDGIRYDVLADALERRNLAPAELDWVRDLARIHAFLDQW